MTYVTSRRALEKPCADEQRRTRFKRGCDRFLLSNGVVAMRDKYDGYWLLAAIFFHQDRRPFLAAELQTWTLTVLPFRAALLTCTSEEGEPPLLKQEIDYTDFPYGQTVELRLEHSEDSYVMKLSSER